MIKLNKRQLLLFSFAYCFTLLSLGAYFQFVKELEPCPLCISQRIAILMVGFVSLIAAIHNKGVNIYGGILSVLSLIGAFISARHVWIQNLPEDEVPECGPGLAYIFENFPLIDTVKLMLSGTGECSEVLWVFLGLSIPAWTFLAFIALLSVNTWVLFRKS